MSSTRDPSAGPIVRIRAGSQEVVAQAVQKTSLHGKQTTADCSGGSSIVISTLMPSRELGSSELMVTQIGLGLAALGRPAYINIGRTEDLGGDRSVEALERRCHAMLDAAYESGVRYVDAARSYGLAESFLASWLAKRGLPRGAVTVGSKWGYSFVGGWRIDAPVHELKDLSAKHLKKQIVESRAILGEWLGLYQIHSATLESGVLEDVEVLTTLGALRADGLVIGLTVSGPRQSDVIRRAFAIQIEGTRLFQVVQATWNLLDPSAGSALAEAKALGWGVIIKEALANGRLTSRANGVPDSLRHFAAGHQTTADVVAIAAAMSQPWADVVLSGAVTTQQLLSNVTALNLVGRIINLPSVAQTPAEYWTRRSTLSWQ